MHPVICYASRAELERCKNVYVNVERSTEQKCNGSVTVAPARNQVITGDDIKLLTATRKEHIACKVCVDEVAIEGTLLRVHLEQIPESELLPYRNRLLLYEESCKQARKRAYVKNRTHKTNAVDKKRKNGVPKRNTTLFGICAKRSRVLNRKFSDFEMPIHIKSALQNAVQSHKITRSTTAANVILNKEKVRKKYANRNANHTFNGGKKKSLIPETRYVLCLEDCEEESPDSIEIKFLISLNNIDQLKLFEDRWQVNVVMLNGIVLMILFSSRRKSERHISLGVRTGKCDVTFRGVPIRLLGAPNVLSTFDDFALLMDIINNLQDQDPVIHYCR